MNHQNKSKYVLHFLLVLLTFSIFSLFYFSLIPTGIKEQAALSGQITASDTYLEALSNELEICPNNTYGDKYCDLNSVYVNVTTYFYEGGECLHETLKEKLETCKFSCVNGACEEELEKEVLETNYTCVEAKAKGLLKGVILGEKGFIINNANQDYEVGLAVYERYDDYINNQIIFDSQAGVVLKMNNLTLNVSLPDCRYQIDLFCGPVLESLHGFRYGNRKFDYFYGNNDKYYCGPFCGDGEINQFWEQCDDGNFVNGDDCNNTCQYEECIDEDEDCVCDGEDLCLDSKTGEAVDINGCDPFQFCGQISCGTQCSNLDFIPKYLDCELIESEYEKNPGDCTMVMIANEGELEPLCTPTTCAN